MSHTAVRTIKKRESQCTPRFSRLRKIEKTTQNQYSATASRQYYQESRKNLYLLVLIISQINDTQRIITFLYHPISDSYLLFLTHNFELYSLIDKVQNIFNDFSIKLGCSHNGGQDLQPVCKGLKLLRHQYGVVNYYYLISCINIQLNNFKGYMIQPLLFIEFCKRMLRTKSSRPAKLMLSKM